MTREMGAAAPYTIREAREADLPVLVEFLAKLALHVAGGPPRNLKEEERDRLIRVLRSSLADQDKLLVVAETPDERLVAMGYLYVFRGQGIWEQADELEFHSGIIDDVWVEPEFRNLGIFRAIIRNLVAFAESHEVMELILEYSLSNREAQAVWTRLGFKPTGVRAAAFTGTVRDALSNGP